LGIFVTFVTSSYLGILEKLTKGGSNAVLCRCQENSLGNFPPSGKKKFQGYGTSHT